MVQIASSFISAAVLLSSVVSAAPAVQRRVEVDNAAPVVAAAPAEANGATPIDVGSIPTGVQVGGSVQPQPTVIQQVPSQGGSYQQGGYQQGSYQQGGYQQGGYNVPIYGSGSVSWHQSYNSCVQQCFVTNPAPPTVVTLPPSSSGCTGESCGGQVALPPVSSGCSGESCGTASSTPVDGQVIQGTPAEGQVATDAQPSVNAPAPGSVQGKVHNVIVAPVKGVFRFVPAFLDVPVGDTVRYTWMNGPHTVTQGSALAPCNGTVAGFTSGDREAGSTFDQVISSTDPIWFFCSVGTHCANGMFGAINAPKGGADSNTTVLALMPQWAAANPDIQTALDMTNKLAADTAGTSWGNKIDVSTVPPEFHASVAANVLYTRAVIAQNPEMVDKNGVFNPENDVVVPNDFSTLLATADAGGYPAPAPAASTDDSAQNDAAAPGSASSVVVSRVAVAAVALVASLLAF